MKDGSLIHVFPASSTTQRKKPKLPPTDERNDEQLHLEYPRGNGANLSDAARRREAEALGVVKDQLAKRARMIPRPRQRGAGGGGAFGAGGDELADGSAAHRRMQILFCSRTHSQLSQFCGELKRRREALFARNGGRAGASLASDWVQVVSLASRTLACTNPDVKSKKTSTACTEACRNLREKKGCAFKRKSALVTDKALTEITPIEDLVKFAEKHEACGYYGLREGVKEADIVLAPYASVLHKGTRESLGITVDENTIVVFDEAHNVFDACADVHGSSVGVEGLQHLLFYLSVYLERYAPNFKEETASGVRQLQLFVSNILDRFCVGGGGGG